MNRRDIKTKNKIGDSDVGNDNELQPLQGFSEGFNSNGINKFGEYFPPSPTFRAQVAVAQLHMKVQQRKKEKIMQNQEIFIHRDRVSVKSA